MNTDTKWHYRTLAAAAALVVTHTGLIQSARSESELASVLAHEIGHVVQRHLARIMAQRERDTIPSLAALAVSILMARANPQLAQAGIAATQAGTVQRQLDYTREHEREADRMGLQILNDSGFDTRAMPSFFETLMKGTRFYDSSAPSFLRTHPLTTERIADVRNRVEQLPYRQVPDSAEFHFVRAKLRAQQGAPGDTAQFFENSLQEKKYNSEAAQHYGLAVALLRGHEFERAQSEISLLRSARQRHPMIESLAAQLLLEQGRSRDALDLYRSALSLFPKHRGLIYGYAETLLVLNQPDEAIRFLSEKQLAFPNDGYLYELQSHGYTRLGKNLMRHHAQGEAYYRAYDLAGAIEQFELASKSGDGDFYQLSIVEARLKQLRQQMGDPKKK